jgi:hypothetical protein
MAITQEDLNVIVQTAVQAALAGMRAGGGGGGEDRRRVHEKAFKRVDNFSGVNWKEWSFQFKVALKSTSPDAHRLVERAERETGQVAITDIELEDGFTDVDVGRISTELFDVLAMLVKGEAFAVVRGDLR